MKTLIFSGFTGFAGFVFGIMYTVQAADNSFLVRLIAIIKGLMSL